MECWHCERPANAVCSFCGRAVCKEHTRKLPNLIVVYRAKDQKLKGLATADAVFCGVCHPKNEPVELEELD